MSTSIGQNNENQLTYKEKMKGKKPFSPSESPIIMKEVFHVFMYSEL